LHLANQIEVGRRWVFARTEHAGEGGKLSTLNTNLRVRIRAKVLDPVGRVVFRDNVETTLSLGKPDFDLAWLPAAASLRGEIQVLFLRDGPSL